MKQKNDIRNKDNRVIVYLEEVIQETDNYIEVSNPNDRCRIFAKPKVELFLKIRYLNFKVILNIMVLNYKMFNYEI